MITYLPLILFLFSFFGMAIMVGRKLALIRNGQAAKMPHSHPFVPHLQKIKHFTFQSAKRFAYAALFATMKFFIISSNSLKIKSRAVAAELKKRFKKNNEGPENGAEKREASKYLKTISDYREKIRKMKHMIKEKEGIE